MPNGMSYDGAKTAGFHVDHIVPLAVISAALPMDKTGRKLAFKMAQDLENLRMIPGAENGSKHAEVCTTEEQEEVFHLLCEKYGVADAMLNTVIPY